MDRTTRTAPAAPSRSRDPARDLARRLLAGVLERGAALDDDGDPAPGLDPAARARGLRLARSTLRHLDRADAALAVHMRRHPLLPVRHILRLAVVEHVVEDAPAHAVVDEAVAAARALPGGAALSGLVNAVLRKALAVPAEDWRTRPPQRMPGWLRGRALNAWGNAAVVAMEAAHEAGAPLDLTPRTADGAAALAQATGGVVLPTGSVRVGAGAQVTALPGYDTGDWWVQDAAAAMPARLLDPRPGERVLDLCAAPGGKTLQLAAAGAVVTALDIAPARLERLSANLARCGLAAEVVAADALDWSPPDAFDAILLDAPCTATGTIRRHPDLPHRRDAGALKALVPLQAALLDRATGWLKPGGRLVFATCSILPDEGEGQLAAALVRHPDLRLAEGPAPAGFEEGWRAPGGGWRLRPDYWADRGGMDGFFFACLRRDGDGAGT